MTEQDIANKVAAALTVPTFEIGDIVNVISQDQWTNHEGTVMYLGLTDIEVILHDAGTGDDWITFLPWELQHAYPKR